MKLSGFSFLTLLIASCFTLYLSPKLSISSVLHLQSNPLPPCFPSLRNLRPAELVDMNVYLPVVVGVRFFLFFASDESC